MYVLNFSVLGVFHTNKSKLTISVIVTHDIKKRYTGEIKKRFHLHFVKILLISLVTISLHTQILLFVTTTKKTSLAD